MSKVHLTPAHFFTILQITEYNMNTIHVTTMQIRSDALHIFALMIKELVVQLITYYSCTAVHWKYS